MIGLSANDYDAQTNIGGTFSVIVEPIYMQQMQWWFNKPINKAQPNKFHNIYG
jgi:hypothetical protein